jgi:hypothetical protein
MAMMIAGLSLGQLLGIGFGVYTVTFLVVLVDKKRRSPEKSFKNHAINILLVPVRAMGLGPYKKDLTLDNAFKYATRKTGLTDFGDTSFQESYRAVLATSTQKAQQYTNLGFVSARIELNMTFVRRLKMIEYLKQVPRVMSVQVRILFYCSSFLFLFLISLSLSPGTLLPDCIL